MTPLPAEFFRAPIAHRGLHDAASGRPENSLSAFAAAVAAGYGIELDLQMSQDGRAMVFHDYALDRLTAATGAVRQRSAAELGGIALGNSSHADAIPELAAVLTLVAGRVPLLIEIKDQDGAMGPNVGALEDATLAALDGYAGPVAVMSFNPHSVAHLHAARPGLPVGLVSDAFDPDEWNLSEATCDRLRDMPDFERVGASFVSHDVNDLDRPRLAALKSAGARILCWTVRSPEVERAARRIAENVTFEGYLPPVPDART